MLIKRNHNINEFSLDTFCRRGRQLFAFFAVFDFRRGAGIVGRPTCQFANLYFATINSSRRCLMRFRHLTRGIIANIHIRLDYGVVLVDIPKHLIFNCPFKEVQLAERGLNIRSAVFMRDVDSVPATKWVEPFLGICA